MNPETRWRLVLGRYAERRLPSQAMTASELRMDAALDFLYGREYQGREIRERSASLDASQLTVVTWLNEVRELFPAEVSEVIEGHALSRYDLKELVTDPAVLERLEPNQQLLEAILTLKGALNAQTLAVARRVVATVVEQIRQRLEPEVRRTLSGRINRLRHSPIQTAHNFDPVGTIRANLKHYDATDGRLAIETPLFFERNTRRLPWDVILCVDQSGSMVGSVIHSAVMAGILTGLPAFRVKLVVFDTSVVDLSEHVDDPVEALMRVQLGGGTDIGQAVRYCAQLVENPHRTVFVLISDFCEGASPTVLLQAVRQMAEARITMIGLAALDESAAPAHDRQMAERLVDAGMAIAALTPLRLAEWLVGVIS